MEFHRPTRKFKVEVDVDSQLQANAQEVKRHLETIAANLNAEELKLLAVAIQKPALKSKAIKALKMFM